MRSFFKIFFAMLLAFVVLIGILFIVISGIIAKAIVPERLAIEPNSVLVLETSQEYNEVKTSVPVSEVLQKGLQTTPGLFDVVRLLEKAAKDDNIKGIYLKAENNANGFATNEEVRNALLRFKRSGKFIYAYGESISQQGYFMASLGDKVYVHPKGGIDFGGFYS